MLGVRNPLWESNDRYIAIWHQWRPFTMLELRTGHRVPDTESPLTGRASPGHAAMCFCGAMHKPRNPIDRIYPLE